MFRLLLCLFAKEKTEHKCVSYAEEILRELGVSEVQGAVIVSHFLEAHN